MSTIKDGTGKGYETKVDVLNRMHTGTVSRSERDAAIDAGRLFIMSTQILTLTDDLITPVIYFKNTDANRGLFIDTSFIWSGASTSGTGSYTISTHANITATSTIITEAKALTTANANIGSSELFVGDSFIGESGDTLVGGVPFVTIPRLATEKEVFEPQAILPNGSSATWAITPPSGNTSMEVSVVITAYYIDADLPV